MKDGPWPMLLWVWFEVVACCGVVKVCFSNAYILFCCLLCLVLLALPASSTTPTGKPLSAGPTRRRFSFCRWIYLLVLEHEEGMVNDMNAKTTLYAFCLPFLMCVPAHLDFSLPLPLPLPCLCVVCCVSGLGVVCGECEKVSK